MSVSKSNEWMNFINSIENSTRIFLTISIRFLVICGVFIKVAGWITRCRLNKKIEDRFTLSRCLLTRWKKDVDSLESWTYFLENSILSKQRFSSMRKFKLCICKKINFFGAADVKLKKDMILAGKLQFYQLQKRKTKKNSGSDGIWTQASQNITTNWATEVNVNSSALMPIYFYRMLLYWVYLFATFFSVWYKQ